MLQAVFWASVALILYTHVGYPLLLWLLTRVRRPDPKRRDSAIGELPRVSLIVAAHDEEKVIADKVSRTRWSSTTRAGGSS